MLHLLAIILIIAFGVNQMHNKNKNKKMHNSRLNEIRYGAKGEEDKDDDDDDGGKEEEKEKKKNAFVINLHVHNIYCLIFNIYVHSQWYFTL